MIDFFTFITKGSAEYAEFLKETCERFSSGENVINWKCIESVNCDRLPRGYQCVGKAEDGNHNSMNHALALNLASKYIESKYVIYADADIAILYKHWDKVVIDKLNETDCFGFEYDKKDPKYQQFPTVYFFAYNSNILDKVSLDFSPKLQKKKDAPDRYKIETPEESKYFNLKIGSQIKCDTGWKLPLIIKSAGFSSESLESVLMTSSKRLLPFKDSKQKNRCITEHPTHMTEWHYKGKIFGTHKQASRNHLLDGEWGKIWKDRINIYIDNNK
jgi:hypothetical protein